MAINISDKYPGRSNPPSVDYPQGSIKNQTAPGARDGTPLDEAWANDKEGFFQSILATRGITANGEIDKVGTSQYYDALAADPTEILRGMPLVATQAETNAGTDDVKLVTPKKLKDGGLWPLGVGQTWQNVTASRLLSVNYTNTTGRAIAISAYGGVGQGFTILVNGVNVAGSVASFASGISGDYLHCVFCVVPAGSIYRFNPIASNQKFGTIMELR